MPCKRNTKFSNSLRVLNRVGVRRRVSVKAKLRLIGCPRQGESDLKVFSEIDRVFGAMSDW